MLRVMLFIFLAAATFGQTPLATPEQAPPQASQKAPPEVEAALRARVTEFYKLQVEGKFNQALQLVAEDTKDVFVGSNKPPYLSFEIQSVRYSGDFTTAQVMVIVKVVLPMEGFMGQPLPMKTPSRWKLENGQWCYYEDPKDSHASPFRQLAPPGMPLSSGGPPGSPRPLSPM